MGHLKYIPKILDFHRFANLSAPRHPLISLIDFGQVRFPEDLKGLKLVQKYYTIGLKRNVPYKLFYGQKEYDFNEGIMTFLAPDQVMGMERNPNINLKGASKPTGWLLLVHPDFLWNTSLAQTMKSYAFFGYDINESLFLSEEEEEMMIDIFKRIEKEYRSPIDKFSQKIIVSQLELLLNYAERFYERQFITRNTPNHQLLGQVEQLLQAYFDQENLMELGLPTVEHISQELHLSPSYLSSMLKSLTGMGTQQHIHNKLIEKAKEQLSTTPLPINEIAYNLGFEYPSSFNKLFKNKTEMSPLEFRKTFN
ncbi:helix-turn-helix domain-containing protein [Zobellia galactanivorans]|uniref:AraC-type transcriptional regulator n=1 Tax=Zobellia galactanivorans (strain DSM 12802 / CCUG 47099 / CIP 106680 / NCIMB 13871 / Dsij) TaxID=63186 RepID=G0L962_ZOBGA|nr:helix-turn-helix transcriptional regulator [Zobellia galactanivorans]CAZ94353.1 AraC-type transcriptional regulator [Zobellia galactanivorans]